jgi:hypothetical protein
MKFGSENWYFNFEIWNCNYGKIYLNSEKIIWIWKLIFEFWKLYYTNLETEIWILKMVIQSWKLLHISKKLIK